MIYLEDGQSDSLEVATTYIIATLILFMTLLPFHLVDIS